MIFFLSILSICVKSFALLLPPSCDVQVEALYWVAQQQKLAYANKASLIQDLVDFTKAPPINPKYDWSAGIRISSMIPLCCPTLGDAITWSYTFFQQDGYSKYTAPEHKGFFPVMLVNSDIDVWDFVKHARAFTLFNMNIFDLQMMTHCFVPNEESYLPSVFIFGGLRGLNLYKKITTEYSGGIFIFDTKAKVTLREMVTTLGPRVGVHSTCYGPCGCSLACECAISGLVSYTHATQKESIDFSVLFPPIFLSEDFNKNYHRDKWGALGNIDGTLDMRFSCYRWTFGLGVDGMALLGKCFFPVKKSPVVLMPSQKNSFFVWGVHISLNYNPFL